MSQSENQNNQHRRYRVEVKRSKRVRRGSRASDDRRPPVTKADDIPSEKVEEPVAEAVQEPEAVLIPEPDTEPETPATEESAPEQDVPAAQDDTAEENEPATDTEDEKHVGRTVILPDEPFDYVVPKETYKQHNSNKHVSVHKGKTKIASKKERDEADSGYVFSKRRHSKHRKGHHHHHHHHHKFKHLAKWKKILIISLAVIMALVIAVSGTYLILREIGRNSMHYDGFDISTPDKDENGNDIIKVDNKGRVITYKGVSYELNLNLINLTFIGVDDGTGENAKLRMADAIYIMAFDTKTGKMKILGISRDTMADVDLYSDEGKFIDTERMQMSFSYAYSSEKEKVTGGKNTTTSLSRLFYSLPLKDYFAINMDALVTLNDTIGGVTLTSLITFTSPIDGRTINKGETVTLHGKEADYYVRHRDIEKLDSNNDRMERQQQYIAAFLSSIIPAAKKDISVISDLYSEIKVNSDSTLTLPKITYIASSALSKLKNADDIEYVRLKGKITKGEYAELNPTNEETMETMLDVFYTPLAKTPDSSK